MMAEDLKSRARGCLAGLAVGDALGGPAEGKTPEQINAKWGRITDFISPDQIGSDDTEYALFNARILLENGIDLNSETIEKAWQTYIIGEKNTFKGAGFSEMLTITNLRTGLKSPESGQHIHSWSDGLAMRVAPFGIVSAGNPESAARLSEIDGSVSHSGEGIYSGQFVAAAIAAAMVENSAAEILRQAIRLIPTDSWTYRSVSEAIAIGLEKTGDDYLIRMHNQIACSNYFWTDIGPEAVALAAGIVLANNGSFRTSVIDAVNIGRDADTIAAITGAICGAREGITMIPQPWIERIRVSKGSCIAIVRDMDVIDTADRLTELTLQNRKVHES
jgi:ADP-ribosylglycohydrolase